MAGQRAPAGAGRQPLPRSERVRIRMQKPDRENLVWYLQRGAENGLIAETEVLAFVALLSRLASQVQRDYVRIMVEEAPPPPIPTSSRAPATTERKEKKKRSSSPTRHHPAPSASSSASSRDNDRRSRFDQPHRPAVAALIEKYEKQKKPKTAKAAARESYLQHKERRFRLALGNDNRCCAGCFAPSRSDHIHKEVRIRGKLVTLGMVPPHEMEEYLAREQQQQPAGSPSSPGIPVP